MIGLSSPKGLERRSLTPREREILKLIIFNYTTGEIAEKLTIRAKTVDTHWTRIMQRLNLHKVTDLVRYAIDRGV